MVISIWPGKTVTKLFVWIRRALRQAPLAVSSILSSSGGKRRGPIMTRQSEPRAHGKLPISTGEESPRSASGA